MERVSDIAKRVHVGRPQKAPDEGRAERQQFCSELEHLAAAYRHELVDEGIRVYWVALKKIPVDIRTAGLTRCLQRIKFFPTVSEVLHACADVVEERRKVLAQQNEAQKAGCEYFKNGLCTGRWRDSHTGSGKPCVLPCDCHQAGLALLANADQPIVRPALPASSEVEE